MERSNVRSGAHWIAAALAITIAACGGDDDPLDPGGNGGNGGGSSGPTVTTSVSVEDNFFSPSANAVSAGARVTWTWNGSSGHNVTFADGSVSAPSTTQSSGTFAVDMPSALGTYTYRCTIHAGMDGSVVVQ